MQTQSQQPTETPQAETSNHATPAPSHAQGRAVKAARVCVALGAVCSLLAWCVFFFAPGVAVGLAFAGLAALVAGATKSGGGCLRDICVTALIASVVLIVVWTLFRFGVPYLVDNL